ncbi:MAG TPA: TM1266 family iron-only hydrogenase system putative regulator [Clostridiaceae bacterium]|jgi:putative iron-only hydrogenase system regulator
MSKRVAVLGIVLENAEESQAEFNAVVADFKGIVKGRMGIPFDNEGISVISIILCGTLDEINSLTGKIGNLKGVTVKTSLSKKEIEA